MDVVVILKKIEYGSLRTRPKRQGTYLGHWVHRIYLFPVRLQTDGPSEIRLPPDLRGWSPFGGVDPER